jgi:hypothetical protein
MLLPFSKNEIRDCFQQDILGIGILGSRGYNVDGAIHNPEIAKFLAIFI